MIKTAIYLYFTVAALLCLCGVAEAQVTGVTKELILLSPDMIDIKLKTDSIYWL